MTKAQRLIDEAFKYISALPVSGDQVEIMAKARELLRQAYTEAGKPVKLEGKEADGNG